MAVSRWLDPTEDRAWRGYRRMFTLLEGILSRELQESTGLSTADYTVLSNLVEVEGHSYRLSALAQKMQWSQSRLSHHITRMEGRGLVERAEVASDGRGRAVSLTRQGYRAIAEAAPVHFSGVRAHMIDLLTPEQLRALGDIAETVVDHIGEPAQEPDR